MLRSECAEGFGCDGRMKRKERRCVYFGEVVVVQVEQGPEGLDWEGLEPCQCLLIEMSRKRIRSSLDRHLATERG